MFKDLRQYLSYLGEVGKLKRVSKEVDPCYDIAAGMRKASDTDGPALLFESIRGHPGWRVVGGLYGTQELMALALDLPMEASEEQILQRYLDCYDRRVKPRRVATGPVKEVVLKGDEVDLTKLPIPT